MMTSPIIKRPAGGAAIAVTVIGVVALVLAGCGGGGKLQADGGTERTAQVAVGSQPSSEEKMMEAMRVIMSYQSAYLASVAEYGMNADAKFNLLSIFTPPNESNWFIYELHPDVYELTATAKVDIGSFAAGQIIYTTYHPDGVTFVNTSTDPKTVDKLLPDFINGEDGLRTEAQRLAADDMAKDWRQQKWPADGGE